jgi:hypothetical protein
MKTIKNTPFLVIILLVAMSCHKDKPVTKVVKFDSTTYQTLGTFDPTGKPNYLVTPDVISSGMQSFIDNTLQDQVDLRTTHPELLTTNAIADIKITQSSDVFITYVSHGGGKTNTFSFYTYPTNQPPASTNDIKTITYVFPNSGRYTTLTQGDKVKLGRFEPGTSIGFVILQNGWDTTTNKLNNKVVHFCSNDVLNPEVDPKLKKHAVLVNYPAENKVLIGFEDVDRTLPECDNDFNDLVVYCTVTP